MRFHYMKEDFRSLFYNPTRGIYKQIRFCPEFSKFSSSQMLLLFELEV